MTNSMLNKLLFLAKMIPELGTLYWVLKQLPLLKLTGQIENGWEPEMAGFFSFLTMGLNKFILLIRRTVLCFQMPFLILL